MVSPVRIPIAFVIAAITVFGPAFAAQNAAKSIGKINIDADGRVRIVQGDGQEISTTKRAGPSIC